MAMTREQRDELTVRLFRYHCQSTTGKIRAAMVAIEQHVDGILDEAEAAGRRDFRGVYDEHGNLLAVNEVDCDGRVIRALFETRNR